MFQQYLQYITVERLRSHLLSTLRCTLPLLLLTLDFKNTEYLQIGRDQDAVQRQESQTQGAGNAGASEVCTPVGRDPFSFKPFYLCQ